MDVKEAIKKRRAYRSLDPAEISEDLIKDLAESASLSCSCFNKQPWNFVFVNNKDKLMEMREALSERKYFLFDTGMAVGMMILRATELGLVAHPIAGFNEDKAKEILNIPEEMRLITLIIVGKHSDEIREELSEDMAKGERQRPPRKSFDEFAWINEFKG
jgi:nitroreductase